MQHIIFPWTLTKRPKENALIPRIQATDTFKSLEANIHEDKMRGADHLMWTVEHIREENDCLYVWFFGTPHGGALPQLHIHLVVYPDLSETTTEIHFQIQNEFDHVKVIHSSHGTDSPN